MLSQAAIVIPVVSLLLCGKEEYHSNLRNAISYFSKENHSDISLFYDTVKIRKNIFIDLKEYIDSIKIYKTCATGLNIRVSKFFLILI